MLIASTMHGINILQITLIGKGVENDREAKNHNRDLSHIDLNPDRVFQSNSG
jgi:hypothetical protein